MDKLNYFLTKFRTDIEDVKKKWHRDLNNYATGRVYNWNSQPINFEDRRPPIRRNREHLNKPLSENSFLDSRMTPNDPGGNNPEGQDENDTDQMKTRGQKKAVAPRIQPTKKKTPPYIQW